MLKFLLGYCYHCGKYFTYPKRRRMNTVYEDAKSNYYKACNSCFKHIEFYWNEMWREYNAGRL